MTAALVRGLVVADRYLVLDALGEGTTGVVYSVWDKELEREVAIKVLHRHLADHREVTQRFEHEIRITARLQHPGIVAVFGRVQAAEGQPAYVMSLARGTALDVFLDNLRTRPDHWQSVSLLDRLNLVLRVLDVLSYAHSQGVVHRDLKPANIVLGEHGEVRVLDWGLARVLHDPQIPDPLRESSFDELFGAERPATTAVATDGPGSGSGSRPASRPTARPGAQGVGDAPGHSPEKETRPSGEAIATGTHRGTTGIHAPGGGMPFPAGEDDTATRISERLPTVRITSSPADGAPVHTGSTSSRPPVHRENRSSLGGTLRTGRSTSGHQRGERSTQIGALLGSPAYMSPEQARGEAKDADERADIYSLGVILVELLTLHTPIERAANESLNDFVDRVQRGDRRHLRDLWPDAPADLDRISEWALARDPNDRYPDCQTFRSELNELLGKLSASFSELERQRLAREREAAWLSVGSWNYAARPAMEPFTEQAMAFEAEPIGQVMHPELNGMLVGGCGTQIYPMSAEVGDDLRMTIEWSLGRGREFCLFARGLPNGGCYIFRIGAFDGKWITISRCDDEGQFLRPLLLTMRALGERHSTTRERRAGGTGRRRVVSLEVVGSQLTLGLDDMEPLVVQDPCPLMGPLHRQLAVGTHESQVVVHAVAVDRRRTPLLLPAYHVANEMLRQRLYPQAIDQYRRFLDEHGDSEHVREAQFMLCLAFLQAGHRSQAERELRTFLSESLDHPLSQDAIFELARLGVDPAKGTIERAVRTVLSYQESGDRVRSRFCLWTVNLLQDRLCHDGLSAEMEEDLKLLRHLIRGFSDEDLLVETIALGFNHALDIFAAKLLDVQAADEIAALQRAVGRCQAMGYRFQLRRLLLQADYLDLARRLQAVPPGAETERRPALEAVMTGLDSVRDLLSIAALGASEQLLEVLSGREPTPALRVLRAAMLLRAGRADEAREDLNHCFRLLDVIEIERTSEEVTATARLAFFGLNYLPWEVVWEPIERIKHGASLQALAGWLAESLGNAAAAAQAWRHLNVIGSGMCSIAEQGLARLGLRKEQAG